jgi:hypothetical protein
LRTTFDVDVSCGVQMYREDAVEKESKMK